VRKRRRDEARTLSKDSNQSVGGIDSKAAGPARFATRKFRMARGGSLVIGRLTEHGRANYQFRLGENASYYVKLLTSRGAKTLWGKDLERALASGETRPKVGDLIGARRAGREAVTVTSRRRATDGRIVTEEAHYAHRTRWIVEKVKFFAERARLARRLRDEQADVRETVRAHPELKSSFLSVRAAQEFAARRIADPKDRERFLILMREAMAASIHRGEPLPAVRLRDPLKKQEASNVTPRPPRPDDPTR
jgi:hypothetical protein